MEKRRRWLIIGFMALVGLIGLIIAGYRLNWGWTGFNQHIGSQAQQYQPAKTLWDWLQLLIIPVVLAMIALLFNRATTRSDQEIAAARYEQDKKIALDKQREDLLQAYLDRMSELLLKEKLRSSAEDAEVRNVARVRTITVLTQLDARRVGYVFAFLREAGLMSKSSVVSLEGADFHGVQWSEADLGHVNLCNTNLDYANLSSADLRFANLTNASLGSANLSQANLDGADLSNTELTGADLNKAYLMRTDFTNAELVGANLSEASVILTSFKNADLMGANLNGARVSNAKFDGACITEEQLAQTKSEVLSYMDGLLT